MYVVLDYHRSCGRKQDRNRVKSFITIVVGFFILTSIVSATELGRLFTTPLQRVQLEKVKYAKSEPKEIKVVDIEEIIEPVQVEKEIIERDQIKLKGLVYRRDGKNTAWINESNTYEGSLESQYIQVPDSKIKPNQVTIIMPDDSTSVDIKVGEAFTPGPIEN